MADIHHEGEWFLYRGEIRQYHLGHVTKVNIINNRTNDTSCLLMGHTEKNTMMPTLCFCQKMFSPNLIIRNNQNKFRSMDFVQDKRPMLLEYQWRKRKREGNCSKFRETKSKRLLNDMCDLWLDPGSQKSKTFGAQWGNQNIDYILDNDAVSMLSFSNVNTVS